MGHESIICDLYFLPFFKQIDCESFLYIDKKNMSYHQNQSDNNLYSNSICQKFFQECLFLILQIHLIDPWQQKVMFQQNIANFYFEDFLRRNHRQQLLNV